MCFGLPGSSIITRSCNFTIGHDLDKERKVKLALSAKLLYIKHLRKKTKSLKQFYVAFLVNASATTYKAKRGIDLPRCAQWMGGGTFWAVNLLRITLLGQNASWQLGYPIL